MGFDPGRAAVGDAGATDIDLFLAAATPRRPRQILLQLDAHLEAIVADSDTAAAISAGAEIPDDLWETATGVAAAIELYRHAVRRAGR